MHTHTHTFLWRGGVTVQFWDLPKIDINSLSLCVCVSGCVTPHWFRSQESPNNHLTNNLSTLTVFPQPIISLIKDSINRIFVKYDFPSPDNAGMLYCTCNRCCGCNNNTHYCEGLQLLTVCRFSNDLFLTGNKSLKQLSLETNTVVSSDLTVWFNEAFWVIWTTMHASSCRRSSEWMYECTSIHPVCLNILIGL